MSHIPHSQFLLERLRKQRERGFLCDCTVTIGEAKYEAHYNVLAAFSDFFSTQSIDVGKGETTIILDPELVTCAVFEKLLDYMYTGSLTLEDELPSIEKAASYLGIQEVVVLCTQPQIEVPSSPGAERVASDVYPHSPLSPDDYEPLEPIEEVEKREQLENQQGNKDSSIQEATDSAEGSQSSSEQTTNRQSIQKRNRKPKTHFYERDEKTQSPISPRGRGRGRGGQRGRPRIRPLSCDRTDFVATVKSPATEKSTVTRGTGRPRGRPRKRPFPSEMADSMSTEESTTVANENNAEGTTDEPLESTNPDGDTEEVKANEGETGETDADRTTLEAENAEEPVVLKRGRGRPRTRPLPPGTVSPVKNEEASTFTPNKEKEKEGPVRKRGRPRVKPLPSETSVNPEGGVEEEISKEVEGDDERGQAKTSSSEAPDNENSKDDDYDDDGPNETSSDVSPTSKIRTSNRKRSLSRKLRENQANSEVIEEEGEDVAREEWDGEQEDNTGQNKHRPICNICGNLFSEMSSLRRHMRIHKGIKPYQCQLCGRCFRQGNQLKTHTRIHTEKPFHCTSCSACFAQKCQLVYHCRMHHGEEKPHKCDVCPASFATSSNLKIHMGEKPYECNDCGKRFTQASTLMYHKRRHTGEKPYVCDTCGMSFAVSSSLIAHSRKHTVTPYICLDCGKPCLTSGELRKHMDIHNIYSLKKHRALKHNGQPMIIQHAEGTGQPMIIQHDENSETPMLIQHGTGSEQVSYVVEQYEIPGSSDMEHAQIVIVQTID
uniref:Myoneurin n=1 Tax=Astyanax mexicanus TaxID=7994 RepID=W5KLG5_ASTMX